MWELFVQFAITPRRVLWVLVLWQAISVLLMALGVWPEWVVWVNVALCAVFILITDTFEGLLLLIVSIPFFVVLPNRYLPDLPTWRVLFIWLFIMWLIRTFFKQKQYVQKVAHFRQMYREALILEQSKFGLLGTMVQRIDTRFFPWDKYIALFVFVALLSLIFAHFRVHAVKQILFLINIYLFYIVLINATTSRERIIDLIKYAAASTGIIVLLGYVQFIATLFTQPYYFWQYWATMVSKLYYGLGLANVLIYSNSWFSHLDGQQSLRMFSIMPDSHSFAMVAVFVIAFMLPLVSWYQGHPRPLLKAVTKRKYHIWYAIRFAGLAVILSGTRGMWVGMIPVLLISGFLFWRKFARSMVKKMLLVEVLIILFFVLTPAINYGLNWMRVARFNDNFLERAASIYDLQESSNVGRLQIWRESLAYSLTHPFGVGYGNFVVSLVRDIPPNATFEDVASEKNLRYNLPQKFVTAHSLYLNLLVELGLAGLLAFAVIWWEYFTRVWRFVRQHATEDNIFTMFVVANAFVMLWFLVYGIFDVTMFNDRVLMYLFISLGITGLILRRYESFDEAKTEQIATTA
jgi:O-antigen ligase